MPLTPQGKTFSARQKHELPLPYGLPAGRGGPFNLVPPRDPHGLYVLYFYNNAASLVLPGAKPTPLYRKGAHTICIYECVYRPGRGLAGCLAGGRTDMRMCHAPGALSGFATTTRPLAGMVDGGTTTAQQGSLSPPSSSSGMQLTWDGHVRLVCVCVCA